jgi:hypothetical protein
MQHMPPAAQRHFAQQHISSAARSVAATIDAGMRDSEENRRAYERFYNNLALFSGGTIALSVTYLGYLKAHSPIVHPKWLIASWVSLIVCLASSLFWTFFHTHYGYYFRDREYWEAVKKKCETEANEIQHLNVVNIQTHTELEAFRVPRRKAAATGAARAKSSERREKFYFQAWKWVGRLARVAFLSGMALLLIFAVSNI